MILSIITINKNNFNGLEKTIKSVIEQTCSDFEYIIIDGASDDNSVEIIKKYSDRIDYWTSEPDTGVYNAMNKGILKASGNYCLFLNSGDYLISSDTLENCINEINDNNFDIYYSDAFYSNKKIIKFPDRINLYFLINKRINHQNTLIRKSLFLNHGLYNENLKFSSDWEFFLNELWKYKSIFFHLKTNISVYDVNGISSRYTDNLYKEDLIVLKNIFNETADIIIEYRNFKRTIYFDIINENCDNILLRFFLRSYKKIVTLFKNKNND